MSDKKVGDLTPLGEEIQRAYLMGIAEGIYLKEEGNCPVNKAITPDQYPISMAINRLPHIGDQNPNIKIEEE